MERAEFDLLTATVLSKEEKPRRVIPALVYGRVWQSSCICEWFEITHASDGWFGNACSEASVREKSGYLKNKTQ